MRKTGIAGLGVLAVAFCALAPAQIRSFTLEEMVDVADDAVHGEIVSSEVFRVDSPIDGPELYFTRLKIEGRSLNTGNQLTVEVTFHGGFLSETEGVYNSEAPSKDDIQTGNTVVVFYSWTDNMGGEVAGNALVASHGGLFRSIPNWQGFAVLGRGDGYAVRNNTMLEDLEQGLVQLYRAKDLEDDVQEQGR